MSNHIAAVPGEIAQTVLMPGDPLRAKFIAENFLNDPVCYSEIRNMYGFTGRYKGVPVSIQGSGMGMPSMGIYSHELINDYGVKRIIRIGTAGSFHARIKIKDVVLGVSASTDSNFSHMFKADGTYAPTASWDLLTKAQRCASDLNISIHAGNILSSDVFYKMDDEWWKTWQHLGVLAVDMEAAALYMHAAWFGIDALTILTISDHFVTGERSTIQERETSFTDMLQIALNTAVL